MSLDLEDDHMCYVCGSKNPHGLKVHFEHPEPGRLTAVFSFSKNHQGFKEIVHGGMMAMLLDEIMVNLAWKEGIPAVTAELTVRLKKPAKIGQKIYFEGLLGLDNREGRVLRAEATAKDGEGQLIASATAVCVKIKKVAI